MTDLSAFARRLRAYRQAASLTQHELAARAGMSAAAVRDLEQGRTLRPRPGSIARLAAALGLAAHDIRDLQQAAAPTAPPTSAATELDQDDHETTITILGPLSIRRGSIEVPLRADRQRVILGRLAMTPNAAVSRQELIDIVWDGQLPPRTAVGLVHTYVARIRQLIQPHPTRPCAPGILRLGPGGYRLQAEAAHLDVLRFRTLSDEARAVAAMSPAYAVDLLMSALALWRGSPAADLDGLRVHPVAIALRDEQISAALLYADLAGSIGDHGRAVPTLRELCQQHPLHEPLHGRLILALAATGLQAAALAEYNEIRLRLANDLGIDPSLELTSCWQRVLQQDWPRPTVTLAAPAERRRPFQTPAPVADFTGRKDELDLLCGHFDRDPTASAPSSVVVCAVAGVGGVGKTALVIQAAHCLRSSFPDGQLYADLQGVGPVPVTSLEVLARFLRALGVGAAEIPRDEAECAALYRTTLADQRVLVILDNARDARQVRALLPGHGGCGVLITSRRRMADLAAAHLVDLSTMPVVDALNLFAETTGTAGALADRESATKVVHACGRLPLAVRIAGARLASRPGWTVQMLAQRLGDQRRLLDELRIGDLEVAASFQLSYQELPPRVARTFRLLAMSPTTEISVPVATAMLDRDPGDVERDLDTLVESSLLIVAGPERFKYHDLVRLYARNLVDTEESPSDADAALHRLYDCYLTRVAAAAELQHPNMVRLPIGAATSSPFSSCDEALAWLDSELFDVVAAIKHAAVHGPRPMAWKLADQLRGYFFSRRYAAQWLATGQDGLAAAEQVGDQRAAAAMHQTLGQAFWSVGDFDRSLLEYQQGLMLARVAGWLPAIGYLLHNIGLVQLALGQRTAAHESYLKALAVSREHNLEYVQAVTLNDLGMMCLEMGQLARAAGYLNEALALNQRDGNLDGQDTNLLNIAIVLRETGRFDDALAYLDRQRIISETTGSRYSLLANVDEQSQVCTWLGEHARATTLGMQALEAARSTHDRPSEAWCLTTLGEALRHAGHLDEAVARLRESLALARLIRAPYHQARALIGLAHAETGNGNPDAGQEHAASGWRLAHEFGYRLLEADALVALALVRLDARAPDDAVALLHDALRLCEAGGATARAERIGRMLDEHHCDGRPDLSLHGGDRRRLYPKDPP